MTRSRGCRTHTALAVWLLPVYEGNNFWWTGALLTSPDEDNPSDTVVAVLSTSLICCH